jgi:hypothetical protein
LIDDFSVLTWAVKLLLEGFFVGIGNFLYGSSFIPKILREEFLDCEVRFYMLTYGYYDHDI